MLLPGSSRFYEKSSLGEFIKRQNHFMSCKFELLGGTCYEINYCANNSPLFPSGLRQFNLWMMVSVVIAIDIILIGQIGFGGYQEFGKTV
jgi:hypothetical protein